MRTLIAAAGRFWKDQDGATAIEYGLIAALVAVAVITGASLLGVNISGLFSAVANCLTSLTADCMSPTPR